MADSPRPPLSTFHSPPRRVEMALIATMAVRSWKTSIQLVTEDPVADIDVLSSTARANDLMIFYTSSQDLTVN